MADHDPERGSLRAAQRELTRTRIRSAAAALFNSRGVDPVTMDEIAKAAHVSRSTLYVHYPDKADLSADIAATYADALCALVERLPSPLPSDAEIRNWIGELAALIEREHGPAALISALSHQPVAPAAIREIGTRLLTVLASRLPRFAAALAHPEYGARARAWGETVMRELGSACQGGDAKGSMPAARRAVAAEIFERFVQTDFAGKD